MRIAINLRRLYPGKIGGLEKYIRQLIVHLLELDKNIHLLLFASDDNISELNYNHPNIEVVNIQESNYGYLILEHICSRHIDIYFCPLLILDPIITHIPTIVNIPDLQHEFFPENFTPYWLAWRRLNYRLTCQCATTIITLSEYSAETLVTKLKADPAKVFSVLLAGNDSMPIDGGEKTESVIDKYSLPVKYGYYPANSWPHKNHITLIRAVAVYNRKFNEKLNIVLTGADSGGCQQLVDAIEAEGVSGQFIFLGYLPDVEVAQIYQSATFLVFPSLFEGFGMPVIEAMQYSCPVLCAYSTSLPEIADDAALYFAPLDPNDLAEKMHLLLNDKSLQVELVQKGKRLSERYSWANTAENTYDIFLKTLTASTDSQGLLIGSAFSVVIVCDKLDIFAIDSILSVIGQDYERTECIVVSGDSILPDFLAGSADRIRLVTSRYEDYYEAVEAGLSLATGEVLSLLKAGDTLLPNALREVSRYFDADESVKVVSGNVYSKDDNCMVTEEFIYNALERTDNAARLLLMHPALFVKMAVVDLYDSKGNLPSSDILIRMLIAIGKCKTNNIYSVNNALAAMHVSTSVAESVHLFDFQPIMEKTKKFSGLLPVWLLQLHVVAALVDSNGSTQAKLTFTLLSHIRYLSMNDIFSFLKWLLLLDKSNVDSNIFHAVGVELK